MKSQKEDFNVEGGHGPLFKITDQSIDPCLLLTLPLLPTLQKQAVFSKNDLSPAAETPGDAL